ncbi:MAG: dephospho-CoA kinase [Oscillospiraceae bacterium]|nr:dephospho-CoA kinase [Oscillospiraceae bacterium]
MTTVAGAALSRPPLTIVGITGGGGAGKSTALGVLADMGATVIDCDAVYHELVEVGGPMLDELAARFSGVVEDDNLNRKALGQIVFHDPKALTDLNTITHGYVCQEVDKRLAALVGGGVSDAPYPPILAAIEAIALFESGLAERCTVTVGILAPMETRIQRIIAKGVAPAYAKAKIKSQKNDAFFWENCDYILENTYATQTAFAEACRTLFERIL